MPEASDVQAILRENLADAGCDPALTRQAMALLATGRRQEVLDLLTRYRRDLLDCCHREQKKLDCLDYLIYTTGKEEI